MKKIILASQSPRRKALLDQIGLLFEVHVSDFDESLVILENPVALVEQLSLEKAKTVAKKYSDAIIIGSDTVIVLDNKIIGKPKDAVDAKKILQSLSGKVHMVVTGLTVIDTATNKTITTSEKALVTIRDLSDKEIDAYVATGEPLDKAGAYGIQEKGGMFIPKVEGDYFTVVGLPMPKLVVILKEFGVSVI